MSRHSLTTEIRVQGQFYIELMDSSEDGTNVDLTMGINEFAGDMILWEHIVTFEEGAKTPEMSQGDISCLLSYIPLGELLHSLGRLRENVLWQESSTTLLALEWFDSLVSACIERVETRKAL
jgi:hypothetical protein